MCFSFRASDAFHFSSSSCYFFLMDNVFFNNLMNNVNTLIVVMLVFSPCQDLNHDLQVLNLIGQTD